MPRVQAVGAERRERLSATTAGGQDLVVAGQAPVAGQTLAQAPPQPKPGPAGEGAVQSGERNTRQPAGDAPLHAAKGDSSDQPDEASPQGQVRFAAATVHTDPLALHGLQLRFDREDEDLDVSQGVPAVIPAGAGDAGQKADPPGSGCWCEALAQHGEPRRPARCFAPKQFL